MKAVPHMTDDQLGDAMENIGDMDYPAVVTDDDRVAVIVLVDRVPGESFGSTRVAEQIAAVLP